MRVIVTRPLDDARPLAETLAARGIDVIIAPLLDIEYIAGDALDLSGVQAVLFTSANGVRAFCHRTDERALPALCVGDATARAAGDAGFNDVRSASGDVDDLAQLVQETLSPQDGQLLHPAGSSVAGDLAGMLEAAGFTYQRQVLYRARKVDAMPTPARAAMGVKDVDGVLLYSPRTAERFVELVRAEHLKPALNWVTAYCLSEAVAERLRGLPFEAVRVASEPTGDALLKLLDDA